VAGRGPAGIVRAVLVEPCGEKNQVAASGGRGGGRSMERWDRRLGKAARHNMGHWATMGESVLGSGHMGVVGSNFFMGFISTGALG
jgi:hypothetical protein